ncbi:MAG: protein translocase subunit SecDF, partial [Muribaculaceae bacterium]|nr:protein translocase subunit SecDF [Muribaculaceae bacterium]
MQSKGTLGSVIAGVIAIFLVLICLFYLSFTFVQNHHEGKADAYAQSLAGDKNSSDYEAKYSQLRKHYIDSINQEKVWMGYNYQEVQRWGVGLGLDLKGGMSVILQVSMPDILRS